MYDEGYYRGRENTRDFKIEADLLVKLLCLERGCSVLDLGCGGGALLARLEREGCRATGADLAEEAVAAAGKAAGGCEVIMADARRLPFEDGSFDRLVSQHLVEHLPDLPVALEEWKRVLAADGIMAMCTPNRLYEDPSIFEDRSHVRIYDGGELRKAVEDAGFTVERSFTVFPGLGSARRSVRVGVPLYRLFYRLPLFRDRGRTIVLSARKAGDHA